MKKQQLSGSLGTCLHSIDLIRAPNDSDSTQSYAHES